MKFHFWTRRQRYSQRHRGLMSAKNAVAAAAILIGFWVLPASAQTLLSGYDFQTTTNGGTAAVAEVNNGASSPLVYLANFGTQAGTAGLYLDGTHGSSAFTSTGTAPQVTAFGGTAVNAGSGFSTTTSGAASLAVANNTSNGKSMVFALSTTGYQGLVLTFATQGTATGFKGNTFSYSTDGVTFTAMAGSVTPATAFATVTEDFSSITALDNASSIYIEYTINGATSTTGNNRLDNIQFNETSLSGVPEPATYFSGFLIVGALGWNQRRRVTSLLGVRA